MQPATVEPLKLTVKVPLIGNSPYTLKQDDYWVVELSNQSDTSYVLNNRGVMSYEDDLDRDLYCLVTNPNGERVLVSGEFKVDVFPMIIDSSSFVEVQPGEALRWEVSFYSFYQLPPGQYNVQMVYHSNAQSDFPDAYAAPVFSEPLVVNIPK